LRDDHVLWLMGSGCVRDEVMMNDWDCKALGDGEWTCLYKHKYVFNGDE
jgi:hypothetical protein